MSVGSVVGLGVALLVFGSLLVGCWIWLRREQNRRAAEAARRRLAEEDKRKRDDLARLTTECDEEALARWRDHYSQP